MQITLVQGLLIALLVFICAIDKHMETFMWFRPLVVAFFTGIILGDGNYTRKSRARSAAG